MSNNGLKHTPITSKHQSLTSFKSSSSIVQTAAIFLSLMAVKPVSAKTYFDIETYGDKELKIATVNKLKQKLRNAILNDITIVPDLLKLAINDALGYDVKTEEGGPDGSIQFEMNYDENKGLMKALELCNSVKKDMQRTNVVTIGDVIAYAGAEALEACGCPRIIVQIG